MSDDKAKCDVCGNPDPVGVACSTLGATSFSYCIWCLGKKAEPICMFESTFDDMGMSVADWVKELTTYRDGEYITYVEYAESRKPVMRLNEEDAKISYGDWSHNFGQDSSANYTSYEVNSDGKVIPVGHEKISLKGLGFPGITFQPPSDEEVIQYFRTPAYPTEFDETIKKVIEALSKSLGIEDAYITSNIMNVKLREPDDE
jgi:hypothetical protein